MELERIKLADLKPLEKNVRKHNEKQIDELVRSLNQFGQTRAMVVDEDNNILIGNGMYHALKKRGDVECDCYRKTGLSEKDKKKLILTDNKVYSLGVDDYDAITDFIADIAGAGDFDIAGFDEDVIKQMTRELDEVEADIMDYGVIPQPVRAEPTTPMPMPHGVEKPAVMHEKQPESVPSVPVEHPHAEEKHVRTIVCPSCGEVIYID